MTKYTSCFRLFLAGAFLVACFVGSGLSAESAPRHPSQVSVDISSLLSFLDTLPRDEKDEQLRDWAVYGLKNELGVSSAEEVPIRHPAMKDTSPGEVSKGRVFPISKNEWAVLLTKDQLKDRPLVGGLIDRKYAEGNALPDLISFFSYQSPLNSTTIDIAYEKTVKAADLFTSEYGYKTAEVSNLSQFGNFLEGVDDVVMVQWSPGSLLLGGRSYGHHVQRSVTIEEIAAIYQAYARGDAKIGFSLDIDLDYGAFADDVEELVRTSPLLRQKDFAGATAPELVAVAGQIRSGRTQAPLIALMRRLSASGTPTDLRVYSALYSIQQHHSYQMARYDGNLQGTQAGMVLFYTDLLAKLWAMDYEGMSEAIGVEGFRPMTEISIPKLYWQGYGRSAMTRLWFGLRQDGFDVYGNKVLFQPLATRVYAASSDLLTPGKEESVPNFQSKEFLGWWDRHYETVADFEPGYHKLNQIQKWSCIIMMLKLQGFHQMDFLLNIPVQRDIDFAAWSKDNDRLKTKISIPFMDKQKYGHQTECLPLLRSKPHPFMGGYGMISGGITLATQADIQAKLQKNDPASVGGANERGARGMMPMPFSVNRGYRWPLAPVAAGASPQQQEGSLQQKGRVVAETQPDKPVPPGSMKETEVPAKDQGSDGTGKKRASIKLAWEKSPSLEAVSLVNTLAKLQQPNMPASKGESIFRWIPTLQSVVRIKEWDTYLIKTSTWIYLKINPSQVGEYPAKAAGSFAEADIFCARPISAAEAETLADGKVVIK